MRIAMTTALYARVWYITTHHDDLTGAKRLIGLYMYDKVLPSLLFVLYIFISSFFLLWWLIPIQWSSTSGNHQKPCLCQIHQRGGAIEIQSAIFGHVSFPSLYLREKSGQSTLKLLFVLQEEKFSTSRVIMVIWRGSSYILEHVSNNSFFFFEATSDFI